MARKVALDENAAANIPFLKRATASLSGESARKLSFWR